MFKVKRSAFKWGTVYELDVTDPCHEQYTGTMRNSRKLDMRNGKQVVVDLTGAIRSYCLSGVDNDIEYAMRKCYKDGGAPFSDWEETLSEAASEAHGLLRRESRAALSKAVKDYELGLKVGKTLAEEAKKTDGFYQVTDTFFTLVSEDKFRNMFLLGVWHALSDAL